MAQAILMALGCPFIAHTADCQFVVLDNFNAAERTGWEDKNPANLPLPGGQQGGGQFTFDLPSLGQSFFHSSVKTTETFELKEGRTVEFRVDLVSGRGKDSFAILAFIPQWTGPNSLAGYGLAKSETDILITKGINKYFYAGSPSPAVKNSNVTLVLNLAVTGGSVHVTGQVLDKDDGNKVIWEKSFVDTPAAEALAAGQDSPPAPFINLVGNHHHVPGRRAIANPSQVDRDVPKHGFRTAQPAASRLGIRRTGGIPQKQHTAGVIAARRLDVVEPLRLAARGSQDAEGSDDQELCERPHGSRVRGMRHLMDGGRYASPPRLSIPRVQGV